MAQMCALCALGFLLKEFFGSGGLFFRQLGVLIIGGGPECGEGTAAENVSSGSEAERSRQGCFASMHRDLA